MSDSEDGQLLGRGFYWDDLAVGTRYHTYGRTITDTDIVNFISCTGMLEPLFTDAVYREQQAAITGRVAPGALIYSVAEGLVLNASSGGTGLAFLHCELDVRGPTFAGDTIRVRFEVIEARPAAKGNRGLVRTRNTVLNQKGETVLIYTPLRLMKGSGRQANG